MAESHELGGSTVVVDRATPRVNICLNFESLDWIMEITSIVNCNNEWCCTRLSFLKFVFALFFYIE